MNREDIIRWATQCKMPYDYVTGEIVQIEKLEAFAALVAAAERKKIRSAMKKAHLRMSAHLVAAEREACAKLCENQPMRQDIDVRDQCASAIRARGETK